MSVKLRDLEQSDLDLIYDWYNDPALFETLVGDYVERPRGEAVEYMKRHWINGDTTLRKIIMAGGTPVGLIALSHIDRSEGRAAIDIFITASTDRGKGYGRQALSQMLESGFTTLGLKEIYLDLLEDNIAARRIYDSCGFQPLDDLQGTAVKNGMSKNIICMTLAKEDWCV